MANKLNRIGPAPHLLSSGYGRLDVTGNLSLTTGSAKTSTTLSVIALNGAIQSGAGVVQHSGSATANIQNTEQKGIGQQCQIQNPDADAFAVELWGSMFLSPHASTSYSAFIGFVDEPATSDLADISVLRLQYIPLQRIGNVLTYRETWIVNGHQPIEFAHGFVLANTSGADEANQPLLTTIGFRSLDAPAMFRYYDPVR